MVLQKRLDYGFSGYQVPPTPKAIRSARRRSSVKKNVGDGQMCAFDLLATVAGELLEGNNSLSPSFTLANEGNSIKKEQPQEGKSKVESGDQGRPHKSFSGSQLTLKAPAVDHSLKQLSQASAITASHCSEKVRPVVELDNGNSEIASTGYQKPIDCTLDNKNKEVIKPLKSSEAGIGSLDDQVVRNRKPHGLVRVDNNEKLPLCTKQIPGDLFGVCQDNINLVSRDDDENLSGCTEPSTTAKAFRPQQYIGDQRIRKFLSSKYWKATPGLKDEEHANTYSDMKPGFHSRKISYRRRRSQRDFPFKKRKLYDYSSVSNSDEGVSSEAITSCPGKSFGYDVSDPAFARSAVAGHHGSFESAGSHVKLRIKSFKVPELFIEVPESATVGSLKRKVMEAVTSILGGGLRVGVLVQGKKIRDDTKTLLQTGISRDTKNEALGFSLEPNPSQDPSPLCHEDNSFLLACDTPQPQIRYPSAPSAVHSIAEQKNVDELPDPPLMNLVNFVESEHDSAPSPPAISAEKCLADSRALVAVPGMNAEALSVVPMRKPKRSESAQRRIRRPFSVSEVEALVQAVEKLGTGRWRDVKLRAFDNAKHRTYVDLKDKWKTLVHTARISPQQRRGEPVPQELLDRVLNAHAYWSQQQAKQHLKQQSETCRLF